MLAAPPVWTAAHYILHDEYCPIQEVKSQLERIRASIGAHVLIHLAVDEQSVVRSLCFVASAEMSFAEDLESFVQASRYPARAKGALYEQTLDIANQRQTNHVNMLSSSDAETLINCLVHHRTRSHMLSHVARAYLRGQAWSGICLAYVSHRRLSMPTGELRSILLFDERATANFAQSESQLLEGLALRVRSTAQWTNRRDALVMSAVSSHLPVELLQKHVGDFRTLATAALEMAVSVTHSHAGAVYLVTSGRDVEYRLIAQSTLGPGIRFLERIPRQSRNALSWSVNRHRPFQISPSYGTNHRSGAIERHKGIQLIVPITGPLASPTTPAVGALVLFRLVDSTQDFSGYDQALARNIALRIALLHTTSLTAALADAIDELRHRGSHNSTNQSREPRLGGLGVTLPEDLREALSKLPKPLKHLAEATHSKSVTMRLALPSGRASEPHGLVLVRCAAHPPRRRRDPKQILRESDGGVTWTVMKSGAPEYVKNVRKDRRYVSSRPGIQSELCVPIKVEGITIGVLNLESDVLDNYSPMIPSVVAFAGAVGQAFAEANSLRARQVIDQAALSVAKRHEIDQHVSNLRKDVRNQPLPTPARQALERFTARTRKTLDEMRARPVPTPAEPATLKEIILRTIAEIDTSIDIPSPPDTPIYNSPLSVVQSANVTITLKNLWQNAISHVSESPKMDLGLSRRRVWFGEVALDGIEHAVIRVENQIRTPISQDRLAGLYRYPLKGRSRELRLGAFLAGLAAQRVGGRVHAYQSIDGHLFTCVYLLPIR